MKLHVKSSAKFASKWALLLCACFILAPLAVGLALGTEVTGKVFAQKVAIGIFLFPILFAGFWLYGISTKKDPLTGLSIETRPGRSTALVDGSSVPTKTSDVPTDAQAAIEVPTARKASVWNFVAIAVGAFMLCFLFLPQIVSGQLARPFYLGAAFWVGVIVYCGVNIKRARRDGDS